MIASVLIRLPWNGLGPTAIPSKRPRCTRWAGRRLFFWSDVWHAIWLSWCGRSAVLVEDCASSEEESRPEVRSESAIWQPFDLRRRFFGDDNGGGGATVAETDRGGTPNPNTLEEVRESTHKPLSRAAAGALCEILGKGGAVGWPGRAASAHPAKIPKIQVQLQEVKQIRRDKR